MKKWLAGHISADSTGCFAPATLGIVPFEPIQSSMLKREPKLRQVS